MAATQLLQPWLDDERGTLDGLGLGSGSVEVDSVDGRFSYVGAGTGSRTLLVLPGFGDAMFPGVYPPGAGVAVATYFARYLDSHTVYLLSRPRGLPDDYTIEQSAADHAALLEDGAGDQSAVDVLGVSMGGMIGLHLAAERPELVDRLVVADSAYRLGDAAREPAQRLLETARAGDWASVRSELARGMFADWRQFLYPLFLQTVGRVVQPRPADPGDVPASIAAILAYDGRDALPEIEQPTLVIGGSHDPYFTADVMAETSHGVRDGALSLIRGGKHGAFHERKWTFDSRVTQFLS